MLKVVFSISSDITRLVQPILLLHSQENAQKLQIWLVSLSKIPSKWGKSTDHDQNVSSWKCSQDTSACQISSHFPHAFWEYHQKPKIWPVSLSQNDAKMRKINRPGQNLISWEGGQDTSACQSSGHSSLAFSRKCQIWSVSLSQNDAKMRKINRWWPKFYQLWSGQDTSACQTSGHSKRLQ